MHLYNLGPFGLNLARQEGEKEHPISGSNTVPLEIEMYFNIEAAIEERELVGTLAVVLPTVFQSKF